MYSIKVKIPFILGRRVVILNSSTHIHNGKEQGNFNFASKIFCAPF